MSPSLNPDDPVFPFWDIPPRASVSNPKSRSSLKSVSLKIERKNEVVFSKKINSPFPITSQQWNDWHWHVLNRIITVSDLEKWINVSVEEKRAIQRSQGLLRFSLTPYWVTQMDSDDLFCPIRRQGIPLEEELHLAHSVPENKAAHPQPRYGRLIHYYADRAVLTMNSNCIVYCRFCPQRKIDSKNDLKKNVEEAHHNAFMNEMEWKQIQYYLKDHPQIREIILSGGEPLLLNDDVLHRTFSHLVSIPSIKALRLETRMVSVLPQRITPELVAILREFQPIYLVLNVNHPKEITSEFKLACKRLADAGIPLASQTVLLRGINDKSQTLSDLFIELFNLRVRPYRLIQCLSAAGTEHFRTSLSQGLKLIESLRGKMPGLSMPEYVVDTLGGKIPLKYDSIVFRNKKRVLLKNFEGKIFVYPEKVFTVSP